ncbi:MAG: hypothetical protein C3F11_21965 [Methylocystaceae bacterium]|nr:MAG: hypothetical protein C3F11_21965 [Methylocystaceae bacterium]
MADMALVTCAGDTRLIGTPRSAPIADERFILPSLIYASKSWRSVAATASSGMAAPRARIVGASEASQEAATSVPTKSCPVDLLAYAA